MTKTINLTGAEFAVTGLDGAHAHIRNDSTDTIYAAKMPGITAGADGVASIPAGQADTLRGISGAVYLLGTGSALIQSDDYVESPFKASTASGGSAVDDVARAANAAHSGNSEIHVTAGEKADWNGKADSADNYWLYTLNSTGNKHGAYHRLCAQYHVKNDDRFYIQDEDGHQVRVNFADEADTLDGKHASDFALAENKFLDDYLSSKTGDIRALVIDLPSGGFGGNTGRLPNITGFPITGDILITWSKSVYSNGLRYGTLEVRSMTKSDLPVYQCSVYNNGSYTNWQKLCDGGDAATLGTRPASDFVLKSDYDALAARVAALEGGT